MKKLFLQLFLICVCSVVSYAGEMFVPKSYSGISQLMRSSDYTSTLYFPDLFEYPDDIETTADLETAGVTCMITADNESLVSLEQWYYYTAAKKQAFRLKLLKNVSGQADVTITLTYRGNTVSNVIHVDVYRVLAVDDQVELPLDGGEQIIDVLANDRSFVASERDGGLLEILEFPVNGSCNVIDDGTRSKIRYVPNSGLENYTSDHIRYRITLNSELKESSEADVTISIHKNSYAVKVIDMLAAPGQFTNEPSWAAAENVIGDPSSGGGVSLGSFGGYVIVGFDQPIKNDPRNPYGVDFSVFGNAFVAAEKGVWTEPGAVQVMKDLNGNGIPDDGEWYELAGSDYWLSSSRRNIEMTYYNPGYNSRYTVPWITDDGEAGAVLTNQFHSQPYFPLPEYYEKAQRDKLTYGGTLIRSSLDKRVPSYIEFYRCPAFGYADNKGNQSDPLRPANPYYADENGASCDGFDISWAVDRNGNYVDLDQIDFVKVYTAGAVNAGWLGEWSTEVFGFSITTPDPDYVPQDYYLNYVGITQLQVPVGHTCQYQGLVFKNGRLIEDGIASWRVENPEIGTIDSNGLFTAKSLGTTKVYFSRTDLAPEDEFEIEVVKLTDVMIDIEGNASTVSNDSIECIVGENIYINVESLTTSTEELNGTTSNRFIYDEYTWSNSNPEVGTIDNGSFKAVMPGRTTLVAHSGIDKSLSDTIVVIVKDIPEVRLLSNPIRISYDAPAGTLTNDNIFTTGNDATVYMEELSNSTSAQLSIEYNKLLYDFTGMPFGLYPIHIRTTCYGVEREFDVTLKFDAETRGTERQILYVANNGDADALAGIPENSVAVKYVGNLNDGDTKSILVDGAFAYIDKGNKLSRYNVAKGECVASVEFSLKDASHCIAVYQDRILFIDGNKLRMLYKTDLAPCAEVTFDSPAVSMSVDNDNAYIVLDKKFVVVGISDMSVLRSFDVDDVSGAIALFNTNDKFYVPRPINGSIEMLVIDGNANVNKIVTDASDGSCSALCVGADIYVSIGNTLSVFNTESEQWNSLPFTAENKIKAIAYDDAAQNLIISDGNIHTVDFSGEEISEITGLGNVVAVSVMAAVADNNAPVAKNISATTIYEYATAVSNKTVAKTSFCTDTENNFEVYVRMPDDAEDWLQGVEKNASGGLKITTKFTGTVDNDSTVTLPVECIDHLGASVMTEVPYKITPRIYKPVINECEVKGSSDVDFSQDIALDEVFYSKQTTYSFSNEVMPSALLSKDVVAELDGENPEILHVTAPAGTSAIGELKVNRTIAHKTNATYTPKVFKTTIPVEILPTSGMAGVEIEEIGIYPNPATDSFSVSLGDEAFVELYTVSGVRVLAVNAADGERIAIGHLPSATYVLRAVSNGKVYNGKLVKN